MSFATGKRVLITGANSGIGFETARILSAYGAEVIMVCRNRERGERARTEILNRDPDADITLFIADLSSRASIESLCGELHRAYRSIHILINNAGAVFHKPSQTDDGLERTFALNHMGPFRLTMGILDLLQNAEQARVITVSSEGHRFFPIDIEDIQRPRRYKAFKAYCNSKLANILFTRELARRYGNSGISAVSLHPGFVRTNFSGLTEKSLSARLFLIFARLFASSPEKGAATSVFLADAPEITNGMYYVKKKLRKPSRSARTDQLASILWDMSSKLA
ncbi:MAG: SDR family oxidoreductase [Spirochaeta sp.]